LAGKNVDVEVGEDDFGKSPEGKSGMPSDGRACVCGFSVNGEIGDGVGGVLAPLREVGVFGGVAGSENVEEPDTLELKE